MNDGEFDYMGFYDDMVNAGWGDDIAVFTGNEIADLWNALTNGSGVDDIFDTYGSGMHQGNNNDPFGNDLFGGGSGNNDPWDDLDDKARADEARDRRENYIDTDDHEE